MASQIKVDQLAGAAANTVTIPAGQTLDVLGTLDIDNGTLVLPNTVVTTTGTQTLTNKTITAPKIGTSILDTNGNELALLTATSSAVNEFTIANASTGNGPTLSATGETNVDLNLSGKGTGHITVRGDTNAGAIQLNCENNSHGQQIKSQPHSTNTTNIMLLPQGADSTLVSLVSADTLTNKTLTNPVLTPTATVAGKIEFLEGTNNGTNKLTLIGPAATADVTLTLPSATDTLVGKATTDTLTNKTLTSPAIGTKISDTNGNELINLTATGSAVNEFTLANASTGNGPILSATGETNVDINLNPKGTGVLKSATAAVKIAGTETMWVPSAAMYGATTNPADAQQVETTATRPDMKVLDFDASTDEFAQFSVAFPKSWNEGTVTYQVYWTPASTNTGDCIFGLQGVSCGDSDTIDVAFGTAVNITDAGIGTVEDQQVSAESSAVTIAGSPAVDQQTYFQIFRDANAGADTYTGVARLLGIKIFYTTDAANDA